MGKFFNFRFSTDIGIDLGTANSVVYVRGKGIVLSEPSIVAIDRETHKMIAVGKEAKKMLGRTPTNIIAMRPMRDGVIADFEATEAMLRHFLDQVRSTRHRFFLPPRVVIAIPSGITSVEKRAVIETATKAGARSVYLIEEPKAAAIGIGLPVGEPIGNFIIDIGGGTTEMAVISLGDIVLPRSIRIGGNEMDESITEYLKKKYNLLIGERTAEEIKIQIGSAWPLEEEMSLDVTGRDLVEGLPRRITVRSEEIRESLQENLTAIINEVRALLENTPPELSSDLAVRGIYMAGGGSLLRGIDRLLSSETKIPVQVADEPLLAVVRGTGRMLEEEKYFTKIQPYQT
ncbi:MAG TPA: rod shape-determining protein [bacterium]|uniref:Cell shape-determining protein MreB n=1 Tax=candidate division TA06 bacterium ADurb.Bin417 TaxID=1852828 RepID=A0A1V5MGN2_UNCT6|nr:MAG: Rod shape-determining protein MreB [candidate division TA06 bacterium ADurb.Bin417]HNQ35295.1 rod shape-determining protein [bacterium]HNS48617.1 rod shape-determining protein [bacterium]